MDALAARLKAGDAEAFEELVRTYGGRLRAVALSVLHDAADADEALQEGFLAAFRSLDRFEGRSQLGTWLHRIVLNAALMKLRAKRSRPDLGGEELLPQFTSNGVFTERQDDWGSEGVDDAVARGELRARVRECVAELPEKFRVPLLLRDVEGLSAQEMAERLGTSANAAKIRLHRARQALRTLLERQRIGVAA